MSDERCFVLALKPETRNDTIEPDDCYTHSARQLVLCVLGKRYVRYYYYYYYYYLRLESLILKLTYGRVTNTRESKQNEERIAAGRAMRSSF